METLFQVIGTAEAETVRDLADNWIKSAHAMLEAIKDIDADTKEILSGMIKGFALALAKDVLDPFQ